MKLASVLSVFFPFGGRAAAAPPTPSPAARDEDIVADVVARLRATNRFAEVVRDSPLGTPPIQDSPSVVVGIPTTWDDVDPDIDNDLTSGTLPLTIRVRDGTADRPMATLNLLTRAAQQALHRQSLADVTLPGRTIVRRAKGTTQGLSGPDWVAALTLEFEYLVNFGTGFDLSEI